MGVSARVAVVAASGLGAIAFVACQSATDIDLQVRTDAVCTNQASWKGVAVYIGTPGVDVESKAPVLTSMQCDATGNIGNLVVVPTGAKDGLVGIRVVAGITRNPEDCAAANYDGCIVARRTVAYLEHHTQEIIVDLTTDCVSNACDLNHTCVNGSCTDTVIAAPPLGPDGGVFVADATTTSSGDAASSGSADAGISGPTVRCGDSVVTQCPANDSNVACCITWFTAPDGGAAVKGLCLPPQQCPFSGALLSCDDTSDCQQSDGGDGGQIVCCEHIHSAASQFGYTASGAICEEFSECNKSGGDPLILCEDRGHCPVHDVSCLSDDALPGYFDCDESPGELTP